MIEDSACRLVLTSRAASMTLPSGPGLPPQILLDDDEIHLDGRQIQRQGPYSPSSPAYVIYTSGFHRTA